MTVTECRQRLDRNFSEHRKDLEIAPYFCRRNLQKIRVNKRLKPKYYR